MSERIVVGVDGSDESIAALRWARREAALRNASLRAIHAWAYPTAVGFPTMRLVDIGVMRESSEALLADAIAKATADSPSTVSVDAVVTEGSAAQALLDASEGADLLVVGARGHGGFLGLVLGSVANQVVHHATCPVVIVPKTDAAG